VLDRLGEAGLVVVDRGVSPGPSVLGTDRLISVRATDAPGCGAGAGSSHA